MFWDHRQSSLTIFSSFGRLHRSCGHRWIQATLVDVQRQLSTTIVNPRPPTVVAEAEAEAEAEEVMAAAEEGAGTMEEKGDLAAEEHHHQATADRPSPVLSFYAMVSSISP
jgi:hypothetical protein